MAYDIVCFDNASKLSLTKSNNSKTWSKPGDIGNNRTARNIVFFFADFVLQDGCHSGPFSNHIPANLLHGIRHRTPWILAEVEEVDSLVAAWWERCPQPHSNRHLCQGSYPRTLVSQSQNTSVWHLITSKSKQWTCNSTGAACCRIGSGRFMLSYHFGTRSVTWM